MPRRVHLLAASLLLALALSPIPAIAQPDPNGTASARVRLLAWHDLARDDPRSRELSGIAWDDASGALYAVTDDAPRIVPLHLGENFTTLSIGEAIPVAVPDAWDGEGIAQTGTGFFISNELGPHVYELDRSGQLISDIPLPGHFIRIRPNLSLESLTVTADGRYLFTANEQALDGDGTPATAELGTTVRILRSDRLRMEQMEWAYRTDTTFSPGAGGSTGLADLAAISSTELLVLERSFVPGVGNSVRVYRVNLDGATNILDVDTLSDRTPVVSKTLVIDLATLADADLPPSLQPQPNRILDNFEGLALGPILQDGGRVLFLISDDNKRATQVPRLLVLALGGA
jgi:hypothetical protein